jgi:hypothetical protein
MSTGHHLWIMLGSSIFGILLGMYAASSGVLMFLLFPTHMRCRGVLFYYALGVAFLGGMTPITLQWLSHLRFGTILIGTTLAASAFITWCCIIYYYNLGRKDDVMS